MSSSCTLTKYRVRRGGMLFFETTVMVDIYSLRDAIPVAIESWSVEHRLFIYNTFIETGYSVVLTQWRFRYHFNIGRHGRVPNRVTIMKWVNKSSTTGYLTSGTAREEIERKPEKQ